MNGQLITGYTTCKGEALRAEIMKQNSDQKPIEAAAVHLTPLYNRILCQEQKILNLYAFCFAYDSNTNLLKKLKINTYLMKHNIMVGEIATLTCRSRIQKL